MADDPWARWLERYEAAKLRDDVDFDTLSSLPVEPLYGPRDPDPKIGVPGDYPYTRGIYSSGYRGRLWTMRQFSGFGTPEQTNERYKYLLDHGQTGLSVAFDMPTLMGRDSDEPQSEGEVGRCGVAIDSLRDMEVLFRDIDLAAITTSMTISGPAPMWRPPRNRGPTSPSSTAPVRPTYSRSTSPRKSGSFRPSLTFASPAT